MIILYYAFGMGKNLSLIEYPTSYVVLDIETTGLAADKSEIIELSAIKIVNSEVVDQFSKLIKPMHKVNSFITNLTGITNEMLSNANEPEATLKEFAEFVGTNIVIGHNVMFDIRFLDYNFNKYLNKSFSNDYIDTLRIARCYLPELRSHRLGILAQYYELDGEGMHRALKDCQITNTCYEKFVEMHKSKEFVPV